MNGGKPTSGSTPNTPGPGNQPTSPAGGGPTTGGPPKGGMPYITVPHGPTSRAHLKIDWEYPVWDPYKGKKVEDGRSLAKHERKALPRDKAIAYISENDPRPLLVLRECKTCNGTDDALMNRSEDNTKTMLLSRWFRCIKLPVDVVEEDHPFYNLFQGDNPPHLWVSQPDGSGVVPLKGDQSRAMLWKVMSSALKASYKKDPKRVVKDLERLIDTYNMIDERLETLKDKLDHLIETEGPKSSKLKKVSKDIEKQEKKKSDTDAKFAKLTQLELKKPKKVKAEDEAEKEAAK